VQIGKPADFFERPIDLHAARFFSDVNEVAGTVKGNMLETPLGSFRLNPYINGNEGIAVIRPEGIRLARKGEQGIEGLIIDRRYLGDRTRLVMRFAGVDSDVNALVSGKAPEKGETANVRFDAGAVLTFTTDNADYI
jgi:iron(III) transport system ATP-binding protein